MIMSVNTIMKKLSAIELESHDVNLGAIEDLSALRKQSTEKYDYKSMALEAATQAKAKQNLMEQVISQGQAILNKINGLGLTDTESEVKRYIQLSKDDLAIYKKAESDLRSIK